MNSDYKSLLDQWEQKKKETQQFNKALEDDLHIQFYMHYNGKTSYKSNNNKEEESGKEEDNNKEDITESGKIYINGIYLDYYFKQLKKKKMDLDILHPTKVLYPCNKIAVHFSYPLRNHVTVTFDSKKEDGFTTLELVDKIVKYYLLLHNVDNNYQFDKGTYQKDKGTNVFGLLQDATSESFAITGLIYNKDKQYWKVECTATL